MTRLNTACDDCGREFEEKILSRIPEGLIYCPKCKKKALLQGDINE